ncbi:MAG: cellulase family glycosylhydrolase [Gemmataceae bacterium]|nr:cellulase family glycosylhydrolase [Gemmataceae bacterium]
MKTTLIGSVLAALLLLGPGTTPAGQPKADAGRWTAKRAKAWYAQQPWLVGCNFIPSTAVNQLEMWQADTFDPVTIDRELKWAAEQFGFNTVRVFLHDLAWDADPKGFKERLEKFLASADRHQIRPMVVFFDDVWNPEPKLGKQPAPRPGVHNSGWMRSPGPKVVNDPAAWGRLEKYVTDVLTTFGKDRRVLAWDLYNEPGNEKQINRSLPLLKQTFAWARKVNPEQPLTVGLWRYDKAFQQLNDYQLAASDVTSFHHYGNARDLARLIGELKQHGRPVICTEWMARTRDSTVAANLPVFFKERVGCYNWGLVSGKTQTIYPWGSKPGSPEPKVWFHDLLRPDGAVYSEEEAKLFRKYTAAAREKDKTPRSVGAFSPRTPLLLSPTRGEGERQTRHPLPDFESDRVCRP